MDKLTSFIPLPFSNPFIHRSSGSSTHDPPDTEQQFCDRDDYTRETASSSASYMCQTPREDQDGNRKRCEVDSDGGLLGRSRRDEYGYLGRWFSGIDDDSRTVSGLRAPSLPQISTYVDASASKPERRTERIDCSGSKSVNASTSAQRLTCVEQPAPNSKPEQRMEHMNLSNSKSLKPIDYIEITPDYIHITITEPAYTTLQTRHSIIASNRPIFMNLLTNDGRSLHWALGRKTCLPGYMSKENKRKWEEQSRDIDPLSVVDVKVVMSMSLESIIHIVKCWDGTGLQLRIKAYGNGGFDEGGSFLLPPIPEGWARSAEVKTREVRDIKFEVREAAPRASVFKGKENSILPNVQTSDSIAEDKQREICTLLQTYLEKNGAKKWTATRQRRGIRRTKRGGRAVISGWVKKTRTKDVSGRGKGVHLRAGEER